MALVKDRAPHVPLCVDLDGTLTPSDWLAEALVAHVRLKPWRLLKLIAAGLRGRAALKMYLAMEVPFDAALLPYNADVTSYIKEARSQGRPVHLVTGSPEPAARAVALHLGLFDRVIATNPTLNCTGRRKAEKLCELFGVGGFVYAGNGWTDLPVWRVAAEAVLVHASTLLGSRVSRQVRIEKVFKRRTPMIGGLLRLMRPHQWTKNLLVFVPLLTSHQLGDVRLVGAAAIAFACLCAVASAGYILNDALDLPYDRMHAAKRARPFAEGSVSIGAGLTAAGLLLAAGFAGAILASNASFTALLLIYLAVSVAYSVRLKRLALIDVFALAGLYTVRIVIGHAVTGIAYSGWLLAFSVFLFLSLALAKRYAELNALRSRGQEWLRGRDYRQTDLELLMVFGVSSAFLSALVLGLYITSPIVKSFYATPVLLAFLMPLALYWLCRIWILAHRGELTEDSVSFAMKDPLSYLIALLGCLILWLAQHSFNLSMSG